MRTIAFNQSETRRCPFCSEAIRAEAIKCRFCAEFLNTNEAKALEAQAARDARSPDKDADDLLFEGRPSLLGMVGSAVRGAFFLVLAALLMSCPVESWFGLSQDQTAAFAGYRVLLGLGLVFLVVFALAFKMLRLKMTCYEVTPDRVEWSRGILDRKVDNLDMFRVIDLKLRRSLLDCLFGIGTVELITTDKTDPQFAFEKMRYSRLLYDIIKKASLEADRRNTVVHLE